VEGAAAGVLVLHRLHDHLLIVEIVGAVHAAAALVSVAMYHIVTKSFTRDQLEEESAGRRCVFSFVALPLLSLLLLLSSGSCGCEFFLFGFFLTHAVLQFAWL
jgi:hypothetical protein